MRKNTYLTGQAGEEAAAAYLIAKGYRIIERDYRFGHIDIDIIACDRHGCLVFTEVKYRADHSCQHPLQAVDSIKQRRISMAAVQYMTAHGYSFCRPCRFDVLAFVGSRPMHIENAFSLSFAGVCY